MISRLLARVLNRVSRSGTSRRLKAAAMRNEPSVLQVKQKSQKKVEKEGGSQMDIEQTRGVKIAAGHGRGGQQVCRGLPEQGRRSFWGDSTQ